MSKTNKEMDKCPEIQMCIHLDFVWSSFKRGRLIIYNLYIDFWCDPSDALILWKKSAGKICNKIQPEIFSSTLKMVSF